MRVVAERTACLQSEIEREHCVVTEQQRQGSVVVTGAANGIGRSILVRLAKTGWVVVGVDREESALEDAVQAVSGVAVVGDIRDNQVLVEARRAAEGAGSSGRG